MRVSDLTTMQGRCGEVNSGSRKAAESSASAGFGWTSRAALARASTVSGGCSAQSTERPATSPCFALPPPPPPPPQLPLVATPLPLRLQFFTAATISHHAAHRPHPRHLRRVSHQRQHHGPAVPDQDRTPAFVGQQDELQQ